MTQGAQGCRGEGMLQSEFMALQTLITWRSFSV